jgi:hypothetical protein
MSNGSNAGNFPADPFLESMLINCRALLFCQELMNWLIETKLRFSIHSSATSFGNGTCLPFQVDQNGVVYDQKAGRKLCKNGAFMAVFGVFTVRLRSVSHHIVIINGPCLQRKLSEIRHELVVHRLTFLW